MTTLEYALIQLGMWESGITHTDANLSIEEEREHLKNIITCILFVEHAKKSHGLPDICCPNVK